MKFSTLLSAQVRSSTYVVSLPSRQRTAMRRN